MKLEQSLEYIVNKAYDVGYTPSQVACFYHELLEEVNKIEDCSVENLDVLFEEYF